MTTRAYALPGKRLTSREPLSDYLAAVASRAAAFVAVPGLDWAADAAGWLHDMSNASRAFRDYIASRAPATKHSSAGAIEALRLHPGGLGRMLALVIA